MGLDKRLFFFRPDDDAPPLRRRDVMDAIIGRLPEVEWRHRILQHGARRVATNEFSWLYNHGGIETLFDPPVEAFLVAIRRVGDPPVYLTCLDLLRRLNALGWIPTEQHADLPSQALEPPNEEEAISLDRVLLRFQPSGPDAHLTRAQTLIDHADEIAAAIDAHIAEHTARHGTLEDPDADEPQPGHRASARPRANHEPS